MLSIVTTSCSEDQSPTAAQGIFAELGEPLPSATEEELQAFERGRDVALRRFTREDGLGPELNVTFCLSCHEKPAFGGSASHYRDFLLVGRPVVLIGAILNSAINTPVVLRASSSREARTGYNVSFRMKPDVRPPTLSRI